MVFSGIALTADLFGYKIPMPSVAVNKTPYRVFATNESRDFGFTNTSNHGITEHKVLYNKTFAKTTTIAQMKPKTTAVSKKNREKVFHVGFLKVHKAGSTTMQNMFFRFGLKHNLNIVIPKSGNYLFSRGAAMPPVNSAHYDIFACHTVYSKGLYSSLLPPDQVKIGIIREPFDRMVSAAYYYRDVWGVGYLKKVPQANFIHNIVNSPDKYELSVFSRTRNSMGKDFGFPSSLKWTEAQIIQQRLDTLNQEFALVMMTERFEESLVLMRRLLNWSLTDIIYLLANTHAHKPSVLSEEELNKFKQTSFMDYAIYNYFTKVFEKKVEAGGEDLQDEVKFFKDLLVRVKQFCDETEDYKALLNIEKSKWDDSFDITKYDCDWMTTKELKFIAKLRAMYKGTEKLNYYSVSSGKG